MGQIMVPPGCDQGCGHPIDERSDYWGEPSKATRPSCTFVMYFMYKYEWFFVYKYVRGIYSCAS